MNGDVNGLLLMADIVLYGSSQDVQGFPPLLTRAMSFGIPVIAPDYPVIKKYVSSAGKYYGVSFLAELCTVFALSSSTFYDVHQIFRLLMEFMG